jgi:two-component system sensor histidine kinase KdpD
MYIQAIEPGSRELYQGEGVRTILLARERVTMNLRLKNLLSSAAKIPGAGYLLAAGLVIACTVAGYHLRPPLSETDIIMFYLVGAVIAAARLGRGPALLYSFLCVSAFNYFFTAPYFTFRVDNPSWWLTFAVMFFASLVISTLAARLREQVVLSARREHEALMLYELMKELAASDTREAMSASVIRSIFRANQAQACIRYPDGVVFGTLPTSAPRLDLPIRDMERNLGTVSIPDTGLLPDQKIMMETFVGLLGAALARAETAQAAQQSRILAEKEKMRNILLSSVSHDLRSPLAAITGAADTLLKSFEDNALLASIRREAARVTRIISNLLDITRIEGGHVKLNMRAYDPAEIIGSAVSGCQEALKAHRLTLNVAADLPFVRMDGLLTSQLIQNLLENAARHTPAGTAVELAAYIREGSFCLIVSDNGPGIPKGQEQEIFNKFATYGHGDRPKGAGLGLAICHAIVTAHQGKIYAQNKAEGGCRFVVEFPPQLTLPQEQKAQIAE